jgi:acyl-CoA synthetase (NDP forming)
MIRPTGDERLPAIVVDGRRREPPRRRASSGLDANAYATSPNAMSAAR